MKALVILTIFNLVLIISLSVISIRNTLRLDSLEENIIKIESEQNIPQVILPDKSSEEGYFRIKIPNEYKVVYVDSLEIRKSNLKQYTITFEKIFK